MYDDDDDEDGGFLDFLIGCASPGRSLACCHGDGANVVAHITM